MTRARKLVLVSLLLAAGAASSGAGLSQQYPTRPIRAIVPFPPGGPTDVIARIVGQKLTERLGQQVVVDNRAGAGGNIGMGLAAQATPDGHTLIFVSSSFVANPGLYRKIPYDPYKSFAPVTNVAASPHAFFTHPNQPVKTIGEMVARIRKEPNKHSIATPGVGTTPDLSAHLLKLDAKLDVVLVPYAGGGPSLAAVLGNQVAFGCQAIPPATPHFKAGRLRPLALTSEKRSPILPDVPTMAEAGFHGQEADTMTALLAPAGTPRAIVKRLQSEIAQIMQQPDVRARVVELGYNIIASTPEQFAAQIRAEVPKWRKVISAAKIQVN